MLICLLNDHFFPCPRTHALHVRKLAQGFIQRGYHYREIKSNEIPNLSAADILYVSNHFSTEPLHRLLKEKLQTRLISLLRATPASLILWSFHTTSNWNDWKTLSGKVVHLGEDLYPTSIDAEPVLQRFRHTFPVLPLKYSSPLHPQHSQRFSVEKEFDFNFVGHGYQPELTQHCERSYRSLIKNTPPTISEVLRINSYRRAEVNLVFHAPSNVNKGIVVERFAEAMSLGGIIFHDHARISAEFTHHPAMTQVKTSQDIDTAFNSFIRLSEANREELREASWETWRQSGLSYFDQAGRILAALEENQ